MTAASTSAPPSTLPGLGAVRAILSTLVALARNPSGAIGLFGVTFFVLVAFVGPTFVPIDTKAKLDKIYQLPSAEYLLGTDYHRKFVTNLPVLSRDVGASERRVGLGEFPIWIPAATNGMRGLQGLPVRYIAPKEGLPHSVMDQSILTNAPHPNAARLFTDWLLGDDFTKLAAQTHIDPVHPVSTLTSGQMPLDQVPLPDACRYTCWSGSGLSTR